MNDAEKITHFRPQAVIMPENQEKQPSGRIMNLNQPAAKESQKEDDAFRFYTPKDEKNSFFDKLEGSQARAVLEEANIQLRGFRLSKTYAPELKNYPENEDKILAYFCEKIAADQHELNNCVKRMHTADLRHYTHSKRRKYWDKCARSVARRLDNSYEKTHVYKLKEIREAFNKPPRKINFQLIRKTNGR